MSRGLGEAAIAALPLRRYADCAASPGGTTPAGEQCSVCRMEFEGGGEEVAQLPCRHYFHAPCIQVGGGREAGRLGLPLVSTGSRCPRRAQRCSRPTPEPGADVGPARPTPPLPPGVAAPQQGLLHLQRGGDGGGGDGGSCGGGGRGGSTALCRGRGGAARRAAAAELSDACKRISPCSNCTVIVCSCAPHPTPSFKLLLLGAK